MSTQFCQDEMREEQKKVSFNIFTKKEITKTTFTELNGNSNFPETDMKKYSEY